MIKQLTKEYIFQNKGCYSEDQVKNLSFINNETILLIDLLNSEISIKDKRWFLYNKCNLSFIQKKELALILSWAVLPIYENKYPEDTRVRECLQAVVDFNNNLISKNELLLKKNNAYAAANASSTAYAYAAAWAASASASADVNADTAAYVYSAAVWAADAAWAADVDAVLAAEKLTCSEKLQQIMINFVNNIE